MRSQLITTLFLILLLGNIQATDDICAKIQEDGQLINAAVAFATCANVLTEQKLWIENWSWVECQKASKNVKNVTVITDEDEQNSMYLLAFVVYDETRNLIVVSFRATTCGDNWKNGQTDFLYFNSIYKNKDIGGQCKLLTGCRMHKGFKQTYNRLKDRIRQTVKNLAVFYVDRHPQVLSTGISYGAAIAAIAAYDLKLHGNYDIICYTFGGPRIGSFELIEQIENTVEIFRFINQADPVPHLPTRGKISIFPFYNPGHEIFIQSINSKTKDLTIKTCPADGEGCSLNAYGQNYNIKDHMIYQEIDYSKTANCQNLLLDQEEAHVISKQSVASQFNNVKKWGANECSKKCSAGKKKSHQLFTTGWSHEEYGQDAPSSSVNCTKPATTGKSGGVFSLTNFICDICKKWADGDLDGGQEEEENGLRGRTQRRGY